MKRVLIVISTSFVPYGGLTTVMMNYYRAMDRSDLQIDFASTNNPPENLIREISANGSRYFNLGSRKKVPQYMRNLRAIIKENRYDVVHINGNSSSMAIDLLPAYFEHVPCRIAHVHSAKSDYRLLNSVLAPFFKKLYTVSLAASKAGGHWLFGEDFLVLNNAIDVDKYRYSETVREAKRKEIGINQRFVVGTVGKLTENKNHSFLIDVYHEICQVKDNCSLVIVGDGSMRSELEAKCTTLGLTDVKFLGMRTDIAEVLQTFDYFVFPSKFEGFGMALLEAQAAGLKCLASNSIPQEALVSETAKSLDLNDGSKIWADCVLKSMQYDRAAFSENSCKAIREKGFDIRKQGSILRGIYTAGK